MLRIFFLLLALAGAALGIAYPLAASNVAGHEIGVWRVFDGKSGFQPAEAMLAPADAPVAIAVDLRTDGPLARREGRPVMTMEVTGDDETVASIPLDFAEAQERTINPQSGETAYRAAVDRFMIVDHDRYRFTFAAGEVGTEKLMSADLILNAGVYDLDPRAIPAGFVMLAIGIIGFAGSFFRRRRENPNSKPPQRWGRGGRD